MFKQKRGKSTILYIGERPLIFMAAVSGGYYQQPFQVRLSASVCGSHHFSVVQWVNVLYDQRMTTALIGRLTYHVELILFPGVNNRLKKSSINETLSKISSQETRS